MEFSDSPARPQKKLGRPRSPLSLKERRRLQRIAKKRAMAGLPPLDEGSLPGNDGVPPVPAGSYDLAAYINELDAVIEFAKQSANPAAYARAVEMKGKAHGLLEEQGAKEASFTLIINGLEPEGAPSA